MRIEAIAPALLTLTIAFSWPRTIAMCKSGADTVRTASLLTMVAAAVSVSAFGLAFSGGSLWIGSLVAIAGILLGTSGPVPRPAMAVMFSVVSLSAYLEIRGF